MAFVSYPSLCYSTTPASAATALRSGLATIAAATGPATLAAGLATLAAATGLATLAAAAGLATLATQRATTGASLRNTSLGATGSALATRRAADLHIRSAAAHGILVTEHVVVPVMCPTQCG